jgi:hypothetical protein
MQPDFRLSSVACLGQLPSAGGVSLQLILDRQWFGGMQSLQLAPQNQDSGIMNLE